MLDDAGFATAWVESRDRARPRGERALRAELRLKGIDPATLESALEARRTATSGAGTADADAAARLLTRHRAALARVVDPRMRRQRAYAILARHGFDTDTCASAARSVGDDEDPDRPA